MSAIRADKEEVSVLAMAVFWADYDSKQVVVCREGQQLRLIERAATENYPIPAGVLDVWDAALAVAGPEAGVPSH